MVRDVSDYTIQNLSGKDFFFFCGSHCTYSFCDPRFPETSINKCVQFHKQETTQKNIEISVIDPNTKLASVYYNGGKPSHRFRIHTDVNFCGLKDQLDQINHQLNHKDIRRVDVVEYRRPSTDSAETLQFSRMKLTTDDDVRIMFSIFGQYNTK